MNADRNDFTETRNGDAPPPADDGKPGGEAGGELGFEAISISDLEPAPASDGAAPLLDVIGCDMDSSPCGPAGEGEPDDVRPPRWAGVVTGEDIVTPEDVRHEEPQQSPAAGPEGRPAGLPDRLDELVLRMDELSRHFDEKLKYDAHKEKIIDRLHGELQEYKSDLSKKYVAGLIMDIIKVIDDARKLATHFRGKEFSPEDPPRLLKALDDVAQDLEDVFQVQGVTPFSATDPRFDPARQRVVRKVDTADAALDKTVAESLAPGYEWDGKVLRRELVAVFTYNPALGA